MNTLDVLERLMKNDIEGRANIYVQLWVRNPDGSQTQHIARLGSIDPWSDRMVVFRGEAHATVHCDSVPQRASDATLPRAGEQQTRSDR